MPVLEAVGTLASAFVAGLALRHVRLRKLAETVQEARARAAIGSRYERAPVPADDPFAPPPPAGTTVLGDLVQNSVSFAHDRLPAAKATLRS